MIERDVEIVNKLGLHARAASKLVACAGRFDSEVWLHKDQRRVNAKSIMGVLMLAAGRGTTLRIEASGEDEEIAVTSLQELIANRFGEDE